MSNSPSAFKQKIFLALIPLFMMLVLPLTIRWQGPYYHAANADPDYTYLINSLAVAQFAYPVHQDHPGTTVQSLGAVSLRLLHPTLSNAELSKKVIADPEHYTRSLATVTAFTGCLILFIAGLLIATSLNSVELGLIFQLIATANPTLWHHMGRFTPDFLLACLSCLLAALLLYKSKHQFIWMGIVSAAIFATKITGFSLFLIPLCLLFSTIQDRKVFRKNSIQFLISGGISLVLFLLPILNPYKLIAFSEWIWRLALNRNNARQFYDGNYLHELAVCILANPNLLALLFFSFFKLNGSVAKIARITLIGQFLIVASRPLDRYFIAATGPAALLAIELLKKHYRVRELTKPITALCLFFSLFSFSTVVFDFPHMYGPEGVWSVTKKIETLKQKNRCVVIPYTNSSSIYWALSQVAFFKPLSFDRYANEAYPEYYIYDHPNKTFIDASGTPVSIDKFQTELQKKEKNICLQGVGVDEDFWKERFPYGRVELLYKGEGGDSLYLVHFYSAK